MHKDPKTLARELASLRGRLFADALRLARDEDEADELVQDTLCRCLERIGDLRQTGKLAEWARVVQRNLFISQRRNQNGRIRTLSFEQLDTIRGSRLGDGIAESELKEATAVLVRRLSARLPFELGRLLEVGIQAEGNVLTVAPDEMNGTLVVQGRCAAEYEITFMPSPTF